MTDADQNLRERIAQGFSQGVPHNRALGAEVVTTGRGLAVTRLAFREEFLGDVDAQLWHSSVAISLIDAAAGLSVLLALDEVESIATLDLRTDYLRPAVAGLPLFARAECYHVTRHIAFVRGELYQESRQRLTGHCAAAFMRTTMRTSKRPQE